MTHVVEFPKLGLSFTMNEVAFSIGIYDIRWYGVIIGIGFALAVLYAALMSKRMNIRMDRMVDAIIVGLIGAIVCARLFYVIFYPGDTYRNNPIEILYIHQGGLAIYGGVIGGLVFGGLTAKLKKLRVLAVLDVTVLGYLIGQCIGRWGNFVNQEAFGSATELPWGMYSDNTSLVVPGANVHPCFLYESLLCLLGFVLLHFFNLKLRRYDGQTFLLYIVWYGVCRFFIEGLRTDSLIIPFTSLKVSQVLAGASVLVAVALLIVFRYRNNLTGCGSKKIREAIGQVGASDAIPVTEAEDDAQQYSTIFGDLAEEEKGAGETESEAVEASDEELGGEPKEEEIPVPDPAGKKSE